MAPRTSSGEALAMTGASANDGQVFFSHSMVAIWRETMIFFIFDAPDDCLQAACCLQAWMDVSDAVTVLAALSPL